MEGHFTLEDLSYSLENNNFRVSRATLYNTLKLFAKLRLVVCHHLQGMTMYETIPANKGCCLQICSVCGEVKEVEAHAFVQAIDNTKLRRFRQDGFSVYIYGICSSCQAKHTRRENQLKTEKPKSKNK